MTPMLSVLAVALLIIVTLVIGVFGVRRSRTTSDFFVASRGVGPVVNASAISGEYLSAGTFLGLAGLVLLSGAEGFWFPIGYAAGYLLVLLFVGAPLRRSGAYTIPDFVQARTDSVAVRRITSAIVLVIGWLYIVPQLHGAAITLHAVAGLPLWVGAITVAVVVALPVVAGGMRAITAVQAFHYWLKLTALLVPVVFFLCANLGDEIRFTPQQLFPPEQGPAGMDVYTTLSLLLALLLGTIGLPHVLVRFYTSPGGASARTATLIVIALVGVFYAVSSTVALVARATAPDLATPALADTVVLVLPSRLVPGLGGELLTALVVAGAFAAFLATASGLVVALAGVVSQDVFSGSVASFRLSAVLCAVVPLLVSFLSIGQPLSSSVGLVFVFAASALTPGLVLSVWWPRLTATGAFASMAVGAVSSGGALLLSSVLGSDQIGPVWSVLLSQPGAWTIPLATATAIAVSLMQRQPVTERTLRFLAQLHTPEVTSDRSGVGDDR